MMVFPAHLTSMMILRVSASDDEPNDNYEESSLPVPVQPCHVVIDLSTRTPSPTQGVVAGRTTHTAPPTQGEAHTHLPHRSTDKRAWSPVGAHTHPLTAPPTRPAQGVVATHAPPHRSAYKTGVVAGWSTHAPLRLQYPHRA